MPGDVGDFSVNIGLGINFLAFGTQFVTLRDTLTYLLVFIFVSMFMIYWLPFSVFIVAFCALGLLVYYVDFEHTNQC